MGIYEDALERDLGIRIMPNKGRRSTSSDNRFCYGANCTWCGPIDEVSSTGSHPRHQQNRHLQMQGDAHGIPCCPICGGMLFEMDSPQEWWKGVDDFAAGNYPNGKPHPYYGDMWRWQRNTKQCYADINALRDAYEQSTGIRVEIDR